MEKENKKMKAPLYKKEKARINRLVTRAKKHDPRIKRFEKEEKEARAKRLKEKAERQKVEQAKRDALIKIREDERQAKLDAAQAKVQAREDAKKKKFADRANRKKIICDLLAEKVKLAQYSPQFMKLFLVKIQNVEYDEMKALLERDDLELEEMQKEFKALMTRIKNRQRGITNTPAPKVEEKKTEVKDLLKDWSQEEITLLTKAFGKWPAGASKRWENITEYIGGKKKQSEVIQMAKKLSIQNMKGGKGLDRKMAAVMKAKNKMDSAEAVKPKKEAPKAVDITEWSQDEQGLLEKGLKQFSSKLSKKERWGKISNLIKTKTPKECF